jgi:hypothetical protein
MPLVRPLHPAFPSNRQLALDATPVVLVNLVTSGRQLAQVLPLPNMRRMK